MGNAYEAIGEGLGGLGSGLAGGLNERYQRGFQQQQFDEQQRQFNVQRQMQQAAIDRAEADKNRPVPSWYQDAVEQGLGVHTSATPAINAQVPLPDENGGLSGRADVGQLVAAKPRPTMRAEDAELGAKLVNPYLRFAGTQFTANAANQRADANRTAADQRAALANDTRLKVAMMGMRSALQRAEAIGANQYEIAQLRSYTAMYDAALAGNAHMAGSLTAILGDPAFQSLMEKYSGAADTAQQGAQNTVQRMRSAKPSGKSRTTTTATGPAPQAQHTEESIKAMWGVGK